MKTIEFIGSSGIGKTTLLRKVIALRKNDDHWLTTLEARIKIAAQLKIGISLSPIHTLRILALRSPLIRLGWKNSFANCILKKYENLAMDSIYKELPAYVGLCDLFYEDIVNINLNSFGKIRNIYHFVNHIRQMALFSYFGLKDVLVQDEGLMHHNNGIKNKNEYIEKVHVLGGATPLGIVHCRLMSVEEFIVRRKKRASAHQLARTGSLLSSDPGREANDEYLAWYFGQSSRESDEKVKVFQSIGIPIIRIDMAGDPANNAKSIYQFIRGVIN